MGIAGKGVDMGVGPEGIVYVIIAPGPYDEAITEVGGAIVSIAYDKTGRYCRYETCPDYDSTWWNVHVYRFQNLANILYR